MQRCIGTSRGPGQAAAGSSEAYKTRRGDIGEPGGKNAVYTDEEGVTWPGPPEGARKRTVALHIGYLGTKYFGLQANKELPVDATIERVLERAIFRAGMIAAVNRDNFHKIKWKRSSRTDKGVHSLATVIGVRVMLHEERFETDPEGLGYAAAINSHLPADIRVFSVQRTTKRFDVRRWAIDRIYEYYLPADTLGLSPEGNSPEDAEKLAVFRSALDRYAGRRAFHNYAGRRSQYLTKEEQADRRKAVADKEATASMDAACSQAESSTAEDAAADVSTCTNTAGAAAPSAAGQGLASTAATAGDRSVTPAALKAASAGARAASAAADDGSDQGEASDDDYLAAAQEVAATEAAAGHSRLWEQPVRFVSERDATDPIVGSHYRSMRHFTADDPAPLVPGGQPCLRLEVRGESFMLHQIRHMVGAAVAVARGILSAELHAASLTAPIRVTLPIAPPHTLLLAGVCFSPFPETSGEEQSNQVERHTGKTLTLREGGQAMLRDFRQQVFDPALNPSLEHPDWAVWAHELLPRHMYTTEEAAAAVAQWQAWQQQLAERRAAKEAAAAEEAAAQAAADAAAAEEAAGQAASTAGAAPAAEVEGAAGPTPAAAGGAAVAAATASQHVGALTGSASTSGTSRAGWLGGLGRGVATAAGAMFGAVARIGSRGRKPL